MLSTLLTIGKTNFMKNNMSCPYCEALLTVIDAPMCDSIGICPKCKKEILVEYDEGYDYETGKEFENRNITTPKGIENKKHVALLVDSENPFDHPSIPQQNVDLTFLFTYLQDYKYDSKTETGHAIYILPQGLEIDTEKVKLYFGKENSLEWKRIGFIYSCIMYLELIKGVNYKITPDDVPGFTTGIMIDKGETVADEKYHEIVAYSHNISHIPNAGELDKLWNDAMSNYKETTQLGEANAYPFDEYTESIGKLFNDNLLNKNKPESEESNQSRIERFQPFNIHFRADLQPLIDDYFNNLPK